MKPVIPNTILEGRLNHQAKMLIQHLFSCYFSDDEHNYQARCKILWTNFDSSINQMKKEYTFPSQDELHKICMSHNIHEIETWFKTQPGYLKHPEKRNVDCKKMAIDFIDYLCEGLQKDRIPFTCEDIQMKLDSICK